MFSSIHYPTPMLGLRVLEDAEYDSDHNRRLKQNTVKRHSVHMANYAYSIYTILYLHSKDKMWVILESAKLKTNKQKI